MMRRPLRFCADVPGQMAGLRAGCLAGLGLQAAGRPGRAGSSGRRAARHREGRWCSLARQAGGVCRRVRLGRSSHGPRYRSRRRGAGPPGQRPGAAGRPARRGRAARCWPGYAGTTRRPGADRGGCRHRARCPGRRAAGSGPVPPPGPGPGAYWALPSRWPARPAFVLLVCWLRQHRRRRRASPGPCWSARGRTPGERRIPWAATGSHIQPSGLGGGLHGGGAGDGDAGQRVSRLMCG